MAKRTSVFADLLKCQSKCFQLGPNMILAFVDRLPFITFVWVVFCLCLLIGKAQSLSVRGLYFTRCCHWELQLIAVCWGSLPLKRASLCCWCILEDFTCYDHINQDVRVSLLVDEILTFNQSFYHNKTLMDEVCQLISQQSALQSKYGLLWLQKLSWGQRNSWGWSFKVAPETQGWHPPLHPVYGSNRLSYRRRHITSPISNKLLLHHLVWSFHEYFIFVQFCQILKAKCKIQNAAWINK